MIITISGSPGSGKSTIGQLLAKKLGFKRYSLGDLQRRLAKDNGMTIEQWNEFCYNNAVADKNADEFQRRLGQVEDNFVIDGRVSWFFIPQSFKIFLKVDDAVAAKRIFDDHAKGKRDSESKVASLADVLKEIKTRQKNELARYKKAYNINYADLKNYDLVLDTTKLTIPQTLNAVLAAMKTVKSKKKAA